MTKLGELLKSEREKRGLSLHEIGMSLKINPKILKAIEDGDQPNLPAKTFLRGFVKSYAQFLRLDVDQTLQMFQEEYGVNRPVVEEAQKTPGATTPQQAQTHVSHPRFENSLKRPDDSALPVASNNRFFTIAIAIVLLTSIAFVAKMMDKYQKESRISKSDIEAVEEVVGITTTTTLPTGGAAVATPANPTTGEGLTATTAETSTSTTLVPIKTETPPTAAPATSATPAPAITATTLAPTTTTVRALPVTTTLPSGAVVTTTTLRPAATVVAPTTTTLRPQPSVTTLPTTTTLKPSAPPTAAAVAPTTAATATTITTTTTLRPAMTEVIIEALNRVSIRFSLNGGQSWQNLTLNPDQVHTFRSRTNVQLEITDGGAVNIIVNGRDRGVPGTIGKPIRLNYP